MGQEEIINALKKYKYQWLTSKQIKEATCGLNISASLRRLRRHKEVKFKLNPNRRRAYLYSTY